MGKAQKWLGSRRPEPGGISRTALAAGYPDTSTILVAFQHFPEIFDFFDNHPKAKR